MRLRERSDRQCGREPGVSDDRHALHEHLTNALTRDANARDCQRLSKLFPEFDSEKPLHALSLRQYLDARPDKFFDRDIYSMFFHWLQERDKGDRQRLVEYLTANTAEFNRALLFLRETNGQDWHDRSLRSHGDYDLVRFIDRQIHPSYLRLVEGVLAPFAAIPAYFSRLDCKKGTDGLDIWQVAQELHRCGLSALVASYNPTVRNAIGHGGITYLSDDIRYKDKKGNCETLDTADVVRLHDDLLDTCNAVASAFRVFLLTEPSRGYRLPQEMLVEELREETRTPWWTVEGCVQSEVDSHGQLVIYVTPRTRNYANIVWSSFQTGLLGEYFAPGYDRYFVSMLSPEGWPGWAICDGVEMRRLRESRDEDLNNYSKVLENGPIYFAPHLKDQKGAPRLETLVHSLRLQWPTLLDTLREAMSIPVIECRESEAHVSGWGAVVNASVVIEGLDSADSMIAIRKHRKRILRAAVRAARRAAKKSDMSSRLPVVFALISVFRRDYRRRRLLNYGLHEDLVCTVRLQRLARFEVPDIMHSTTEDIGNWRIAWNKAWLDTGTIAEQR